MWLVRKTLEERSYPGYLFLDTIYACTKQPNMYEISNVLES